LLWVKKNLFLFLSLLIFSIIILDPLNTLDDEDESQSHPKSDLSTSDYHSFVATTDTSLMVDSSPIDLMTNNNNNKTNKMFDITELLGSPSFDDKQEICNWFEKLQPISTSSPSLCVMNYLCAQTLNHDQDIQWQIEQNHLKYGKINKFQNLIISIFFYLIRFKTIITK